MGFYNAIVKLNSMYVHVFQTQRLQFAVMASGFIMLRVVARLLKHNHSQPPEGNLVCFSSHFGWVVSAKERQLSSVTCKR